MNWLVLVATVVVAVVEGEPDPVPAALNNYHTPPQSQNMLVNAPPPSPILDVEATRTLLEKLIDNHTHTMGPMSHQSVDVNQYLQLQSQAESLLQQSGQPSKLHSQVQSRQQGVSGQSQQSPQSLQPPQLQPSLEALQPQHFGPPPRPNPLARPEGIYCPPCLGPDCCEMCVERNYAAPEAISLLELALNPFFYVQYVEDCTQAQYLDNVCFLFIPLLDLTSLYTLGQIVTFQDGTVEQRQFQVSCDNDAYRFKAIGSGCSFTYEVIYADELCGVYVFQRCFEHHCCQIDSGPIQIVSTSLPAAWQCLNDALVFVQKLYPCKVMVELPQENPSLCSVLGNTLLPSID